MIQFDYYQPTRIVFETGGLTKLVELVRSFGTRMMLVTGRESMKKQGIVGQIKNMFEEASLHLVTHSSIKPNPTADSVSTACEKIKREKIDVLVALGGGSVMDAAKAASLAATHTGDFWEYRLTGERGITQIQNKLLPVITVPTTAGTGSEISPAALISKGTAKELIVSPYMFPKVALVDPQLTVSLPSHLTAQIGIDALTQSIEAYVSANSQPLSDIYAEASIKFVAESIRKAFSNGQDLEARAKMSLAGILSSKAINLAGVGAAHALSDPLSGRYDVGHGLAVSILLPAVLEFNLDANYKKYARIAQLFGEDVSHLSDERAAKKSVEIIRELLNDLGLTQRLNQFNISENDIDAFAPEAFNPDMGTNPKKMTLSDVKSVYSKVV